MRLGEIADRIGGTVVGDPGVDIRSAAAIDEAGPGQIAFIANPRYLSRLKDTRASAVIVSPGVTEPRCPLIVARDPYLAFARALALLYPKATRAEGISSSAFVSPTASLGKGVSVAPFVYIGDGATIGAGAALYPGVCIGDGCAIGEETVVYANAAIYPGCRIGRRVIIHSGAVIGADGFGFARDGRHHVKIPQVGIVEIEDDVEIGANTTVDRATLGRTLIRRGTKIDNLVQVAHNVVVGEDCIIVSQVGISGSTRLGNSVTLAGQVGLVGHITVGDDVMIGAQSGVGHDVPAGSAVSGTPAFSHKDWLKAVTIFQMLPELRRRIQALEKKMDELKEGKSS